MSHFLILPFALQSPVTLQSVTPGVKGSKSSPEYPTMLNGAAVWAVAVRASGSLSTRLVYGQNHHDSVNSFWGYMMGIWEHPWVALQNCIASSSHSSSQVKWVLKIFIFTLFIPSLGFVIVVVCFVGFLQQNGAHVGKPLWHGSKDNAHAWSPHARSLTEYCSSWLNWLNHSHNPLIKPQNKALITLPQCAG